MDYYRKGELMSIVITNRFTGQPVYQCDGVTELREAFRYPSHVIDLRQADLRGLDLSSAYLLQADLREADLSHAKFQAAQLDGALLVDAVCVGTDFSHSRMVNACLTRAHCDHAVFTGANMRSAQLDFAELAAIDLSGANITSVSFRDSFLHGTSVAVADLLEIRDDLWAVLSIAPYEASIVLEALKTGRIDGQMYNNAKCGCLIGTIARAQGKSYKDVGARASGLRPIESFFLNIRPGSTPENNQFSALVVLWIEEWLSKMRVAFGVRSHE